MALEIITESGTVELDSIELEGSTLIATSTNEEVEAFLRVSLNFDVQADISPQFLTLQGDQEDLFLLKNQFASQTDVVSFRVFEKSGTNDTLGYIYTLSRFLDADLEDDTQILNVYIKTAVFRGLLKLVLNEASIAAKTPDYIVGGEYLLSDFFDENLILLVIPTMFSTQVPNFAFKEQYLAPLYRFGYYGVFDLSISEYELNDSDFIRSNYASIEDDTSRSFKILKVRSTPNSICNESYFSVLYTSLIAKKTNVIIRFYFIYQVIEILSDFILKKEIIRYVNEYADNTTGFKLKEKLSKFGTEQYRISRLFTSDYSEVDYELSYELIIRLNVFLDENFTDFDADDDNSYKLAYLIYKLRNNIVHNYKFLHEGEDNVISQRNDDLLEIIRHFEYLMLSVISSFKK